MRTICLSCRSVGVFDLRQLIEIRRRLHCTIQTMDADNLGSCCPRPDRQSGRVNLLLQSFSAAFPRNAATVRAPSPAESCREVQRRQYRLTFLLKGTGPAAGIQPPQHSASKAGPTLQGKSSRGASFTSVKQLREHWRFGRFRASRFGNPGRASPPGRLPETLDPSHFGRFPRLVKSAHGKG